MQLSFVQRSLTWILRLVTTSEIFVDGDTLFLLDKTTPSTSPNFGGSNRLIWPFGIITAGGISNKANEEFTKESG